MPLEDFYNFIYNEIILVQNSGFFGGVNFLIGHLLPEDRNNAIINLMNSDLNFEFKKSRSIGHLSMTLSYLNNLSQCELTFEKFKSYREKYKEHNSYDMKRKVDSKGWENITHDEMKDFIMKELPKAWDTEETLIFDIMIYCEIYLKGYISYDLISVMNILKLEYSPYGHIIEYFKIWENTPNKNDVMDLVLLKKLEI